MKRKIVTALLASALLAQANDAFAELSGNENSLVGSDTLQGIMNTLMPVSATGLGITDGDNGIEGPYLGQGSSQGDRQMTGAVNAGEETCTEGGTGDTTAYNSGCQEIAPSSAILSNTLCTQEEAPNRAESMRVAKDGIVIVTNNSTYGQYGDVAGCTGPAGTTPNNGAAPTDPPVFTDVGVGELRDEGTIPANTSTGIFCNLPTVTCPAGTTCSVGSGAGTCLLNAAYTIGGGGLTGTNAWKDVLRIIYTGCQNTDGNCYTQTGTGNHSGGAPSVPRLQRCDHPVRHALISNLSLIMEGDPTSQDCGAAGDECEVDTVADNIDDTGLRRAYRRDDASGTTRVFLNLLGLRDSVENLASRPKITATLGEADDPGMCTPGAAVAQRIQLWPIPEHHAFCDGGMRENIYPDCKAGDNPKTAAVENGYIIPIGGDPIRKQCKPEEDLCAWDGKYGVVSPVPSAGGAIAALAYPPQQCGRGVSGLRLFMASGLNVCPNGRKPVGDLCYVPYRLVGGVPDYNCLNLNNSLTPGMAANHDGRSLNSLIRDSAGAINFVAANNPNVANFRHQVIAMATGGLNAINGYTYAAGDYLCNDADATRNIGCFTGYSACTIGFSGREAAYNTVRDDHLRQEPFLMREFPPTNPAIQTAGQYPFARDLYLNALGGFANIMADCMARGTSVDPDYCAEEIELAQAFGETDGSDPSNIVGNAIRGAGFIPLNAAECVAICGAVAGAPCGGYTP